MNEPLEINDIKNADVIAIGEVTNYKIVPSPKYPLAKYARFQVHIERLLKGRTPKVVTVVWTNSAFGEPPMLDSGPFLIALTNPSSATPPLYGIGSSFFGNAERNSFLMLQAPCSPAFMLNPSDEVVASVRRVLKGETVDQQQIKGPLFVEPSVPLHEKLEPYWKTIGAGLAGILFLGFLGITLFRGRQRKNS